MDNNDHDVTGGQIETATFDGVGRRRSVVAPWRVADQRPTTWWSRLASLVVRNDDDPGVPEIETRGTTP
jgi:hypothetical protein